MDTIKLKKLPIGIQTFQRIRDEDYLYIDKTKDAYDLINTGSIFYFLSRPRRFGKSLFMDTLQDIFEGKKDLFKGLYIYDKYNWEEQYPVIKIGFRGDLRSGDGLKTIILKTLKDNQKRLNIECESTSNFGICFEELIQNTYEKYNQQVVILIDEYDKAILDNLDQMDVASENREIIKSFYSILKDSERYIKFCLLTGVSKFSRASIFSGLNMIDDISLVPRYGNICGYTQEDIETTILPYLKGVDLPKLKKWYNGYNFLKDDVYNPFDILKFINNDFIYKNYWFESGTPTFLIKLIEKNNYFIPKLSNLTLGEELFSSFDIDNLNLEVILYQAGYLTIDKVIEKRRGGFEYKLKIPNLEVKLSFYNIILDFLTNQREEKLRIQDDIYDALFDGKLEDFKSSLVSLFSSLANDNYRNNSIAKYEGYYASVVYTYLASLGLDIIAEDVTNKGRIDLTIKLNNYIYIIEFKVGSQDALQQIKDKDYASKYLNDKKDIYLVGINFDKDKRNISKFEWEKIE